MTVRIGLMGFGRVGRNIFRILAKRDDLQVAAVSDVNDAESLAYLLKYDTLLGRFPEPVSVQEGGFVAGGKQVKVHNGREPGDVPWGDLGVDVVVEATGRPRSRQEANKHLEQGAKRVILCVPSTDAPDATILMGINEKDLQPQHRIISNASIMAHCAVPIARMLDEAFGIERLFYTTVHAYTNDQRLADMPGEDLRRSRAASENIIPTHDQTGAIIAQLVPNLRNKVTGMGLKVPVSNGSLLDMVSFTKKAVTVAAVNEAVRAAVAARYQGIVEYTTDPIVSSDVKQSPFSGVFDSLATQALGDHAIKTIAWFDNGWGYAHRAIALVEHLAKQKGGLS